MIESRQDILHLLQEYIDTDHEYESQHLIEDHPKWSVERYNMYQFGAVFGKFQEDDNRTIQTLKMGVSDEALLYEYCEYFTRENKTPEELENNDFQTLSIVKLVEKYNSDWEGISPFSKVVCLPYSYKKVLLFLYFAFENYKSMPESPYNPDISYLTEEYQNIFNKQSQFGKYGLVPIDQDRTLLLIDSPRIYDKLLNKTFYTKNISLGLLKQFSDMLSNGLIKNLAVRLMNKPGYNGEFSIVYLTEALERGELFKLVNLDNYSVSKLYSKNYNDSLWVVIDPPNITFEEFCEKIDVYNEMNVTQVVHLQYENIEGESYITHLDHEYVFYTQDEYNKRQNDVKQKGEAQKRLKSFKIDNSKIPFTFNCEIHRKDENGNDLPVEKEQFLCYVLECYFKHKDLLDEYFQKVIGA